jgi:hypothetical protein
MLKWVAQPPVAGSARSPPAVPADGSPCATPPTCTREGQLPDTTGAPAPNGQTAIWVHANETVARDDSQQPSTPASRRLLCHAPLATRDCLGHAAPAARHEPGVLTGARFYELPVEARETGCRADQCQSGFSPETPVTSRESEASAAPSSRGRSSPFAGTFSVCTQSDELLAMQKVEGSNPFSRFKKGPAK